MTDKKTAVKKVAPAKKSAPKKEAAKKVAAPKKAAVKKDATKKVAPAKKVAAPKKDAPKKVASPKPAAPKKDAKTGAPGKGKQTAPTGKKQPEMSKETEARVNAAMARFNGAANNDETREEIADAVSDTLKKTAKRNNPKVTPTKDILMDGRVRALRHQVPDAVYTDFAALDNKNLKAGNKVVFDVNGVKYTYAVTDSTLTLIPELFESDQQPDPLAIFKAHNIDPYKLAQKCCGYAPDRIRAPHALPAVKPGDLANLTRFALAMYLFSDGAQAVNMKMYNRHWKYIDLESIAPGAPELPLEDEGKEE